MLSKVVVFSALLAVVLGATVPEPVPIIAQNSDVQPDGTYQWGYESGDGTSQEQHGVPKPVDKEIAEVVEGSVSFTDPEGGKHDLKYVADETGYHPVGADIPVAPEIPLAIARGLEYIASHPSVKEV